MLQGPQPLKESKKPAYSAGLVYIDPVFNVSYALVHICGPIYHHVIFSHGRAGAFYDGHDDGTCLRDDTCLHDGTCLRDGICLHDHICHKYDDRGLPV